MIIPGWELAAVDTTLLVILVVLDGVEVVDLEGVSLFLVVVADVVALDDDDDDDDNEDCDNMSELGLKNKSVLGSKSWVFVGNIGASDGNMNGVDA